DEISKLKDQFLEGCAANGVDSKSAEEVFRIFENSSRYSFNRCLDGDTFMEEWDMTIAEAYDTLPLGSLELISFSIEHKKFYWDAVKNIQFSGYQEVLEISLSNNQRISCTKDHKFLCQDNTYHSIEDIIMNGLVMIGGEFAESGEDKIVGITVDSVINLGSKKTYSIEMTSDDHNYVIGSAVSKNSHSSSYGALTCATIWFKKYYPIEFYTSLLNSKIHKQKDVAKVVYDDPWAIHAYGHGIKVYGPCINRSEAKFCIEGDKSIRWGLYAIKSVGNGLIDAIIQERNR